MSNNVGKISEKFYRIKIISPLQFFCIAQKQMRKHLRSFMQVTRATPDLRRTFTMNTHLKKTDSPLEWANSSRVAGKIRRRICRVRVFIGSPRRQPIVIPHDHVHDYLESSSGKKVLFIPQIFVKVGAVGPTLVATLSQNMSWVLLLLSGDFHMINLNLFIWSQKNRKEASRSFFETLQQLVVPYPKNGSLILNSFSICQ